MPTPGEVFLSPFDVIFSQWDIVERYVSLRRGADGQRRDTLMPPLLPEFALPLAELFADV